MSQVVRHVCESISPASRAHAEAARALVAPAGTPMLERLAAVLGGAQHTPRPRAAHKTIVVAAGDHGAGDPGIAMGADHPTAIAARAIADGTGALAQVARAARAPIVIVDAGAREPLPEIAVRLGRGPTADLMSGPAMTVVDAVLALEAGIALAVSLVEAKLDVLSLGAIGVGAELSAAALLAAATGVIPEDGADPGIAAAGARGAALVTSAPLDRLAELGGPETAVLAGLILGAASTNVAVVLDSYATGTAALAAVALAPAAAGYLVAAHRGNGVHPAILAHLNLTPVLDVGLGHGEGTGAAMVLPLIDQVAALASAS